MDPLATVVYKRIATLLLEKKMDSLTADPAHVLRDGFLVSKGLQLLTLCVQRVGSVHFTESLHCYK